MKNKIFYILILCLIQIFSSQVLAQNNQQIKCEMSVDEILRQQPFDIDDSKAEIAEHILKTLFNEIGFIYEHQKSKSEDLLHHYVAIDKAIKQAKELAMNITMFDLDFKAIDRLKNK